MSSVLSDQEVICLHDGMNRSLCQRVAVVTKGTRAGPEGYFAQIETKLGRVRNDRTNQAMVTSLCRRLLGVA